jgi:hypothetical protein
MRSMRRGLLVLGLLAACLAGHVGARPLTEETPKSPVPVILPRALSPKAVQQPAILKQARAVSTNASANAPNKAAPAQQAAFTCPPRGFDALKEFNITEYISAPWYVQAQVS